MPEPTAQSQHRPQLLLWLVPLVIVGWWTSNSVGQIFNSAEVPGDRFRDFLEFYSGGEALVRGTPLYDAGRLGYIYPPLLAVLLMPLAHLPISWAAIVWLAIKSGAVLASIWFGSREMAKRFGLADPSGSVLLAAGVVAAIGTALLADKLRAEYRMQQSNALLLLCWTLSLVWLQRRPMLAGAVLGFAVTIKYIAIIALPYLLIRRRFKAAAALVLSTGALCLAPALVMGWDENLTGLGRAFGGIETMLAGSSQRAGEAKVMSMTMIGSSVSSAVVRVMGLAGLNPASLGVIGLIACGVFAIAWSLYRLRGQPMFRHAAADGWCHHAPDEPARHRMLGLEWSGLIVAALAFSPQTNSPHLVQLLLVAMAIGAAILSPGIPGRRGVGFGLASAAVLLIGLTLPPATAATKQLVDSFRHAGWPAWTMLVSYLLLLAAAVPQAPVRIALVVPDPEPIERPVTDSSVVAA